MPLRGIAMFFSFLSVARQAPLKSWKEKIALLVIYFNVSLTAVTERSLVKVIKCGIFEDRSIFQRLIIRGRVAKEGQLTSTLSFV